MTSEVSEDSLFQCAICGVSESDASNLTTQSSLLINATVGCGHPFCSTCVERELSRRKTFPCPICNIQVKRTTLSTRSLDDVICEKDTGWRRRILKVFNKVQADFASLLEYNNYLEEVEDMIFTIVNEEPQAEEVKAKIKKYEEENKKLIVLRQSQRADEDRSIADRIAFEQRETERKKRQFLEEEKAMALAKKRYKLEATQVSLGEREEVSRQTTLAAQMLGYRNEILQQQMRRNNNPASSSSFSSQSIQLPRVREPKGGFSSSSSTHEKTMDREMYRRRQAAGGGIRSGSTEFFERNWNISVLTLFWHAASYK